MSTPLTDSIQNLTDYINEVTSGDDNNLSDAVATLAAKYNESVNTDVPLQYQKVEYIMSDETGGQYIDTGITGIGDSDMKIEITYAWHILPASNSYQMIIGAYANETSLATRILQKGSNTTYVQSNRYAHDAISVNRTRSADTIYDDVLTFSYYDSNGTRTPTNGATTGEPITDTLHLFASSKINSFSKALRLYGCTIFNGDGIVVRNFIPCRRISDNEPGLYDTITDVFYINNGSGSFTCGTDV